VNIIARKHKKGKSLGGRVERIWTDEGDGGWGWTQALREVRQRKLATAATDMAANRMMVLAVGERLKGTRTARVRAPATKVTRKRRIQEAAGWRRTRDMG